MFVTEPSYMAGTRPGDRLRARLLTAVQAVIVNQVHGASCAGNDPPRIPVTAW